MKNCEDCGVEIDTKDGENKCPSCEEREANGKARSRRAAANRKARDQVMRDLGLTKVRGALGGTYYE